MEFHKRPGALRSTDKPTAKFSAAYDDQVTEANDYLDKIEAQAVWADSVEAWKTTQITALQSEIQFTSGAHVAPANRLLNEVMTKLGPGSANQVRAARRAGGE